MTGTFYEQPILNSPYEEPALHHALDEEGQPTDNPPITGRRRSERISPVPKPRKSRNKPDPAYSGEVEHSFRTNVNT
jgi:type III restriction enzyme